MIDLMSLAPKHGWKYPHERFFAGLHRDSVVSIPYIGTFYYEYHSVQFLVVVT